MTRDEIIANKHDLRDAYLCGANLCDAELRGANLRGANLRGANLCDADLLGANLRGADLCGADLRGAYLRGANLRGADLFDVELRGANLRAVVGYRDAGQDPRGYHFRANIIGGVPIITAGCRRFTISEATAHWHDNPDALARVAVLAIGW